MSFFAQQTRTVEIDAENTVTIRALSYGEEQEIQQRSMRVAAKFGAQQRRNGRNGTQQVADEENVEGEAVVDPILSERLTLTKSIEDWSGPGFDGREPTPENIEALPRRVVDPIVEAINELRREQELTEEEKNG